MAFRSRVVSVTEEKRILVGMIVSTDFLKKTRTAIDLNYFINPYLQTVAEWCLAFYDEHGKAPNSHLKDIYETEACRMTETNAELISDLLKSISEQYDEGEVNVDYLVECFGEYVRKRELEITVNNINVLSEKGDIEGAEKELEKFKRVSVVVDSSCIVDPGNADEREDLYRQRDEEEKKFFQLPGDLGRYLGNHKRGDVVGFYAPAKRGKSFTLVNYFKHAVEARRKTAFFSIEMSKTEVITRVDKAFFPMVDEEEGVYTYPTFDCILNQTGDCADRESTVMILDGDSLRDDPKHVECIKCMGTERYEQTIYAKSIFRNKSDIFSIRKNFEPYRKQLARYGKISVHPKYTLTYDKMMRDLEVMSLKYNFTPDILLIDYIDILGINSGHDDFRLEDERWKLLAKVAGETNTLVVTVTQANKIGHTAEVLDASHQGGFYGKNRHVNLMVGLNQKPEEKRQGIMRFGITEARSLPFIPGQTCTVLQDLQSGQAYLDSYYGKK